MRRSALVAAVVSTLVLGACGDSPEDKARDNGKQVGQAARVLFDARSVDDAKAAAADLRDAADGLGKDAREAVSAQVATQSDALSHAAAAVQAGDLTALKSAVQDVAAQADAFRGGSNSVANEFWRGFEEGYGG